MAMLKELCLLIVIIYLSFEKANCISVMSVDLGSEFLKIAIVKPGVPMEIALNKESRRKSPFIVSMKGNERDFGDQAMNVANKQPAKAFRYISHLLGKKFDSPAAKTFQKRFPHYTLVEDKERGTILFQGEDDQLHSVEELVAMVLNNTRQIAATFAKHPMKDIVLTVPVYYNQAERKALLDAANMTGMNVLQLMNDNTAVALNYGIFRASSFNSTPKHIVFYDMGASHTTATIVSYSTTKVKDRGYAETVPQVAVKGVGFDVALGGLEMDIRLRDHLVQAFKKLHKTKKDITENPRSMAKMLKEAKRVRQVLSANNEHLAQIENVFEEKDFRVKVTRSLMEEQCADLFSKVYEPVQMALNAAAMTMDDIDSIILMGGGSRIPRVQELLLKHSGKTELGKSINTDEAAALGAVYKGADLTAGFKVKRFIVKDLNLYPIDVKFERTSSENNEIRIINRNLYHRLNPLPQKKIMTFNKKPADFNFNVTYGDLTFLSKDLQNSLDLGELSHFTLKGVDAAHEKNDKAQAKGVKAYFNLDESGLFHVEKVEAHFEKSPKLVKEEEQSTFSKIGSKLSSFFGSTNEDDETVEANKDDVPASEDDEKKDEDSTAEKPEAEDKKKKETSKEEKKDGEKKDEEKKKEEEKPKEDKKAKEAKKEDDKKETPKADEAEKASNTSANATDETSGNKTEEVKPSKPVVVKENIEFSFKTLDIPIMGKKSLKKSVKKLNDLESRDQEKYATEEARSKLESFMYEVKEQIYDDAFEKLSTSDERETIEGIINKASDWLDDEGFDADEKVLKKKLKEIKEGVSDLRFKISENSDRPKAIASMLQSFNISNMFIDSIAKMPDSSEIYTEKDVKDIKKIFAETKEWLSIQWKKQNETDATKKPVLLSKDIASQQAKLDRELMYLINKAKYYVPKPKPKVNETATNGTKSSNKTEKAKKSKSESKDGKKEKKEKKKESADKAETKKEKRSKKKQEEKTEEEPVILELDSSGKFEKVDLKSKEEVTGKESKPTEKTKSADESTEKGSETETKKNDKHTPEDEL